MNEEDRRVLLNLESIHEQTLLHRIDLSKLNVARVMLREISPVREEVGACRAPLQITPRFNFYLYIEYDKPLLLRMHLDEISKVAIGDVLNCYTGIPTK